MLRAFLDVANYLAQTICQQFDHSFTSVIVMLAETSTKATRWSRVFTSASTPPALGSRLCWRPALQTRRRRPLPVQQTTPARRAALNWRRHLARNSRNYDECALLATRYNAVLLRLFIVTSFRYLYWYPAKIVRVHCDISNSACSGIKMSDDRSLHCV